MGERDLLDQREDQQSEVEVPNKNRSFLDLPLLFQNFSGSPAYRNDPNLNDDPSINNQKVLSSLRRAAQGGANGNAGSATLR